MSQSVQYVTNQQGERVGVLLDLETYHKLTNASTADVEILTGLSLNELQALAETALALRDQAQLDHLLARMEENQLSPDDTAILRPSIGTGRSIEHSENQS